MECKTESMPRATPPPPPEQTPASFLEAHREGPADEVHGIGDLARELDTTTRAIRFYEAKGLVTPRRVGTTRIYGRRERARLQLILRAKKLGLTLREIGQYLDLYGERGEGRKQQLEVVIERCSQKIHELEEKRARIEKTLAELHIIQNGSQERLRALERRRR